MTAHLGTHRYELARSELGKRNETGGLCRQLLYLSEGIGARAGRAGPLGFVWVMAEACGVIFRLNAPTFDTVLQLHSLRFVIAGESVKQVMLFFAISVQRL